MYECVTAYGFTPHYPPALAVGAHHPTGARNDYLWDDPQFVYSSSILEAASPHSKQLQSSKVSVRRILPPDRAHLFGAILAVWENSAQH